MNICTNGNMFLDFWFSIHLSSSSHVLKPSHRIYWSSKVTYYFTPMQVLTWQGIYIHVKSKSVKCKLSKYFLHLKTVNRPHEEIFSISWSKKWFIFSSFIMLSKFDVTIFLKLIKLYLILLIILRIANLPKDSMWL